ncbi:acyltransferase family protein [Dechloromonas denitrificans]|nr:acyltransferase [Dechloromonas denitrificans]
MHRTIKGFDGIRGLAVIAVVLTHLGVFGALLELKLFPPALMPMIHGGTGVQAFFVLSGFLITTLLINEFNNTGCISIRHFILRRTLRIFPLYILFLIVVSLLHIAAPNITSWDSLFYAYIYSYNFIPTGIYTSLIGHTWSLAVEEHFYLVWPTVFLLLFGRYRLALLGLVLTFIVSAPLLQLYLVRTGLAAGYFVERWSFIAGYAIAIGCLSALLIGSPRTARTARGLAAQPACLALATLLYANSLYLTGDSWFLQNIGGNFLRTIGIALGLAWLYFNQDSRLTRGLEFPPLKYIGLISYGIYMYQGLFLDTGPDRIPGQTWPPDPGVGLVLLVLVAPLSYQYFEKPFLRLKNRYSPSKTEANLATGKAPA